MIETLGADWIRDLAPDQKYRLTMAAIAATATIVIAIALGLVFGPLVATSAAGVTLVGTAALKMFKGRRKL